MLKYYNTNRMQKDVNVVSLFISQHGRCSVVSDSNGILVHIFVFNTQFIY